MFLIYFFVRNTQIIGKQHLQSPKFRQYTAETELNVNISRKIDLANLAKVMMQKCYNAAGITVFLWVYYIKLYGLYFLSILCHSFESSIHFSESKMELLATITISNIMENQ